MVVVCSVTNYNIFFTRKFTKSGTKLESGLSTSKTYIVEPNKLLSKSKTKKLTDTKSKFIKDVSRGKSAVSLRDLMSSAVPSTSNSTKLNVDDLLTDVGCPDVSGVFHNVRGFKSVITVSSVNVRHFILSTE